MCKCLLQVIKSIFSNKQSKLMQCNVKILEGNKKNGVNYLNSRSFNKSDTRYILKCDFALCENITIPDNCILEFDGGSIKNTVENGINKYTLRGSHTVIKSPPVQIFDFDGDLNYLGRIGNINARHKKDTVFFAGTWKVDEVYPEWFGAKGDAIISDEVTQRNYGGKQWDTLQPILNDTATDDQPAIQKALYAAVAFGCSTVRFLNCYLIESTVRVPANIMLEGGLTNYYHGKPTIFANFKDRLSGYALDSDIYTDDTLETKVEGVPFKLNFKVVRTPYGIGTGDNSFSIKNFGLATTNNTFGALRVVNNSKGVFENIHIVGFNLGVFTTNVWCCKFSNIFIDSFYLGLVIGQDSTVLTFESVDLVLRKSNSTIRLYGVDVNPTPNEEDKALYEQLIAVPQVIQQCTDYHDPTTNTFIEYHGSLGVFFDYGSAVFNGCTIEGFDSGVFGRQVSMVWNNPYFEYINKSIFGVNKGRIVVNNMYGVTTRVPSGSSGNTYRDENIGYGPVTNRYLYVADYMSALLLNNCHAGKCWSPGSPYYQGIYYSSPIYTIRGKKIEGRSLIGCFGNNNDNYTDYPELDTVYISDNGFTEHFGMSTFDTITPNTFFTKLNDSHIFDNVKTVVLVDTCTFDQSYTIPEKIERITFQAQTTPYQPDKICKLYWNAPLVIENTYVKFRGFDGDNKINVNIPVEDFIYLTRFYSKHNSVLEFQYCDIDIDSSINRNAYLIASGIGSQNSLYYPEEVKLVFNNSSFVKNGADLETYFITSVHSNARFALSITNVTIYPKVFGTFADKPQHPYVHLGDTYFCTDKYAEGSTNAGLQITFYDADHNYWMDANGNQVTENSHNLTQNISEQNGGTNTINEGE